MTKHKKAYQIDDCNGEHSVIVFAHHNVVARREGAAILGDEFEYVDGCRRAPQFDEYHWTGKVPARALLASGWHFESGYNYERVTIEDSPDYYISNKDDVYSNITAYENRLKDEIKKQIKHLSIIKKTKRKFPFAQEINYCHSWKTDKEGNNHPLVYFRFSDKRNIGTAEWWVDTDILYVSKCDLEEWEKAKEKFKKGKLV